VKRTFPISITIIMATRIAGLSADDLSESGQLMKGPGRILAWGSPGVRYVAPGTAVIGLSPVGGFAILSDRSVFGTSLTDVKKVVVARSGELAAIKMDGTVSIARSSSLLNVPDGLTNVVEIQIGQVGLGSIAVAVKSDGNIVTWGDGVGSGNPPTNLSNVKAIAISERNGVALKNDGTIEAWGQGYDGAVIVPPVGLSDVAAVGANYFGGYALKNDGSFVRWTYSGWTIPSPPPGLPKTKSANTGKWSEAWSHSGRLFLRWPPQHRRFGRNYRHI